MHTKTFRGHNRVSAVFGKHINGAKEGCDAYTVEVNIRGDAKECNSNKVE